MPASRIYADFNGIIGSFRTNDRSAVVLDTFGTLRELSNAGIILKEGFEMTLYDWSDDEEDLEADVAAYYDFSNRRWVGEFDEKGLRYVPKKHRDDSLVFHCWSCREDITSYYATADCSIISVVFDRCCPTCGVELSTPLQSPVT